MSEPLSISDEQSQSASDISPPSMSAHEALQKLWTQPPQPLPGPNYHPFFTMFAPNAYGSLLQPNSTAAASETHPTDDAEIASKRPAVEMPLLYPFVPTPSICMEPMTPEKDYDTRPVELFTTSISQPSTPSLSFSNSDEHESSPEARPASVKRRKYSRTLNLSNAISKGGEEDEEENKITPSFPATATAITTNHRPAHEDTDKTEVEAICILNYMRAIPNSGTSEPAVIAHGQIWRSPNKKKGWRRNQWIVDVR